MGSGGTELRLSGLRESPCICWAACKTRVAGAWGNFGRIVWRVVRLFSIAQIPFFYFNLSPQKSQNKTQMPKQTHSTTETLLLLIFKKPTWNVSWSPTNSESLHIFPFPADNHCSGLSRHHSSQFFSFLAGSATLHTTVSSVNTVWYIIWLLLNKVTLSSFSYSLGYCRYLCDHGCTNTSWRTFFPLFWANRHGWGELAIVLYIAHVLLYSSQHGGALHIPTTSMSPFLLQC